MSMRIGFAEYDITPPLGKQMPGGTHVMVATQPPRGKLLATAAVFEAGDEQVLLVSVDMLHMRTAFADSVRARIASETGVPLDHVMVCATHAHTAGALDYAIWDCPADDEVVALTAKGMVEAAKSAMANRTEGGFGVGLGEERRYSFCRDYYMGDTGTIRTNPGYKRPIVRPVEVPDYSVNVMRAEDAEGNILAFIVNYANHPDCHGGAVNKDRFSADYPGALRRTLKRVYGEEVKVLFFNGTAGDINCIDFMGKRHLSYYGGRKNAPEAIGAGLGATVIDINNDITLTEEHRLGAATDTVRVSARKPSAEQIAWAHEVMKDPEAYSFADRGYAADYVIPYDEDYLDVPVYALRVGPWAIVGLPGEIFTVIGRGIKERSPFKNTLVFELANGCFGYFTPKHIQESPEAYEATIFRCNGYTGPETAQKLEEKALELLHRLAEQI